MFFHQTLAALLPLISYAYGAPTAEGSKKGFTIKQQATGKYKFKSGPIAVRDTYAKYNKTVPFHIQKAAQMSAESRGSVAANPQQYDSQYLSPVYVGSGRTLLNLDFDTGSSDLWVFSSLTPSSQRGSHRYYTPSSSSTSRVLSGETWRISYGDGSGASGTIYADSVTIGGVTATSQAVECATSVSASFAQGAPDGLVGLAFDSINTARPSQVPQFFTNVRSQLDAPVFSAYLRHAAAGSYDFGYIDTSKYTGSLTYVSVNRANGFWEFIASGYAVGSTRYTLSLDTIADTGTSLIYLPDSVINNYWGTVSGAQYASDGSGVIFPCSASLPTLSINIGGVLKTVPGSYLNFAPYGSGYCFGGLQSSSGLGINILGDVFLKTQYVVHDVGNTRIGFATQR